MFTSAAAHKHDWRTNERRSCSREALNWIVLVFFGQNNWGKLVDLSEKGMCFQFEQTPPVKEPIEFTFEAMGCMSIPHEANAFGDSFQAAGRVVWTHEFERTAGVQFLNLPQRSRDQIRYWLSSAAGQVATAAPPPEAVNVGHTAGLTEDLKKEWNAEWNRQLSAKQAPEPFTHKVPPQALPKAPAEPIHETSELGLEELGSHLESIWQPEPAFRPQSLPPHPELHGEPQPGFEERNAEPIAFNTNLLQEFEQAFAAQSPDQAAAAEQRFWAAEPAVAPHEFETPGSDAEMVRAVRAHDRIEESSFVPPPPAIPLHDERQRRGQTLRVKPQKARPGYVAAVTCLGTLIVAAAVIAIANKSAGKTGVGEVAPPAPESRMDAGSEESSALGSPAPFLVEVLDTSSRRSVLWFTSDSRQDVSAREVQRPALSSISAISRDPIVKEKLPASAEPDPVRDFTLASPHAAAPEANAASNSEAPVAPAIGDALPTGDAFHGTLPSPAAPVERTIPVGGDVQPARLIRAVLPVYPQLAKSNRVAGDVTMDALIDASGNVKDVSVISGPVFFREAAKAALKQWKYEPARLDGQPTAMHLTVTVKFKNDQK